jgi:3-deoxy-D-manno-octulosonic-acid transferase
VIRPPSAAGATTDPQLAPRGLPRTTRLLLAVWGVLLELVTWAFLVPWVLATAPAGARSRWLADRLGRGRHPLPATTQARNPQPPDQLPPPADADAAPVGPDRPPGGGQPLPPGSGPRARPQVGPHSGPQVGPHAGRHHGPPSGWSPEQPPGPRAGRLAGPAPTPPTEVDLASGSPRPAGHPTVWIHAAGAGEVAAAFPLVRRLAASGPLLWTTQTAEGLARARGLLAAAEAGTASEASGQAARAITAPDGVPTGQEGPSSGTGDTGGPPALALAPFDRRRALRRFLTTHRVAVVVLVEVELWPGLLASCHDLGVPVVLASARLHPGDLGRYRWLAPLLRPLLATVAFAGAQSLPAARELARLGVPPGVLAVTGDTKRTRAIERFAAVPPGLPGKAADAAATAGPLTVVAASTHPGEEKALLLAWRDWPQLALRLPERPPGAPAEPAPPAPGHPAPGTSQVAGSPPPPARLQAPPDGQPPRLILAPRDPRRATTLIAQARRLGLAASTAPGAPIQVLDRLGTLDAALEVAAVVVLGGSLTGPGAHDPWPAAAAGKPLVVGPRFGAAEPAITALLAAGGAIAMVTPAPTSSSAAHLAAALASALAPLLADAERRTRCGGAARRLAELDATAPTTLLEEVIGALAAPNPRKW